MDIELQARLNAIELLLSAVLAERLAGTEDKGDVAGRALGRLLAIVNEADEIELGGHDIAVLRARTGDRPHDMIKAALRMAIG